MNPEIVRADIASYRAWAYTVSPEFGRQIDQVLIGASGLGDGFLTGLQSVLNSLVGGVRGASEAAQTTYQQYLEAQRRAIEIREAAARGIPVEEYRRIVSAGAIAQLTAEQGRGTIEAGITDPGNTSILGIPTWMFVAGAAFLLLYKKL